ncbi:MAG: DUF2817 domain-containing protein, partial [Proteobacteria bacterium]|nr:DUF2817 domain-containing protein [Pseudomonadota bacterium]
MEPIQLNKAQSDLRCFTGLLPELDELLELSPLIGEFGSLKLLGEVYCGERVFPLIGVVLGTLDKSAPTFSVCSGVHGLERIGSQVSLSYLRTFLNFLQWDKGTQDTLQKSRFAFFPVVNPVGMFLKRRSNGQGVDLMRNAPVTGENISPFSLYSGHRISPLLPWYRGSSDAPMEYEAQVLCQFIQEEVFPSRLSINIDVHSGYGAKDRFWFPYAKTKTPFNHLAEVFSLKNLFDKTYPNHVYRIEPQSSQYVTHGDLWDYLYDHHQQQKSGKIFLPFCLEMGSWLWVRK